MALLLGAGAILSIIDELVEISGMHLIRGVENEKR